LTQKVPWLNASPLTLLVGHTGSGKTECAVNLALALAESGYPTALADLDSVNPYFRSMERKSLMEERGVRLVSVSQSCANADIPAIPAELNALLQNEGLYSILDMGGGPGGARVLSRFRMKLRQRPHRVCFVLNANRPATSDLAGAMTSLREIESALGLSVTHIIHNTHLCGETTPEDIRAGISLARQLSAETNLPILCHAVHHSLVPQVSDLSEPVFPIHIHMHKPWEVPEL